jgi:predicted RecA/RadA family phage recombinase
MRNFRGEGRTVRLTAPSGGVVSGLFYQIGDLIGCANYSAAVGQPFDMTVEGEYEVPKATGQAWTEGQIIYWDNAARNFTTTAGSNKKIGHALAAAIAGATVGQIRVQAI